MQPHIWELDCSSGEWVTEPLTRRGLLRTGAGTLLGATVLGGLAACGGSDSGSSTTAPGSGGKAGNGKTIALSLNGFNTYDQNQAEGCLKALAGTSYKFIGAHAGFDATKEVANIKQLIARQPDGLIVLAASADGAARACLEAKRQGIPVVQSIWFPSSKEADSVFYAVTVNDSKVNGQLTLDFITKDQGVTEGKILEITGLDAQPVSEAYKTGFRKALAARGGLKIVASQQGLYTADGALKALRPMLSAHPDAKVIIDFAAEMGVAIAQELERQGRKDIIHITSDGNDRMIPWLKKEDGAYLKGDRYFSAADQGIAAVNILRAKLEKGEDPTESNIGVKGFKVRSGTKDPIQVDTYQTIATAKNIDSLPPFSQPAYANKIPFGA